MVPDAPPPPQPQPLTASGLLRYAWQTGAFWLSVFAVVPLLLAVMVATLGRARFGLGRQLVRAWGRFMLWALGVQLDLAPEVTAELARRRRRIVTFNHSSTLDMMVFAAIWPVGMIAVVKKEMLYLPLFGLGILLMGFAPLNRRNAVTARASMRAVATRIRREELTLLVAPEGTRSRTGALLPFKLGAFHAAADADAPIVPIVIHGTATTWPRHWLHCRPGTLRLTLLPEQPSGAGQTDRAAIHERAAQLRALYQRALTT